MASSEGNATAGTPKTPGQVVVTKLFDTIHKFSDNPIFYDALLKVEWKIKHGTLGKSYDIVDLSDEHKDILLNLRGRIDYQSFYSVARNETELQEYQETYAYANYEGITFNSDLIVSCKNYYEQGGFRSVDEALKTMDGLSFSGVIQESFEHELAHRKIRVDYLQTDQLDTPEDFPLQSESGFAVQRKIREDNAKRQTMHQTSQRPALGTQPERVLTERTAIHRLSNEPREQAVDDANDSSKAPRVLEIPSSVQRFRYVTPLRLQWGSFAVYDGVLSTVIVPGNGPVTFEELVEHLKYGGIADPTRGFIPEGVAPEKRGRSEEDGEDGGGKRPALARNGSSGATRGKTDDIDEKHQTKLRPRSSATSSVGESKAEVKTLGPRHAIAEAPLDPEKPLKDLYDTIVAEGKWDLLDTKSLATLDARFLDEKGQCRSCFSPSESIYVSLTFSNPTENEIYVPIARNNFSRGGLKVTVEGAQGRERLSIRSAKVVAKIAPGESHTFLPRKLCEGPKPTVESKNDRFNSSIPFWTPEVPGTYQVGFSPFAERFSFVISNDQLRS